MFVGQADAADADRSISTIRLIEPDGYHNNVGKRSSIGDSQGLPELQFPLASASRQ